MRLKLAAFAAVLCAPSVSFAWPVNCTSADVPASITPTGCGGRCSLVTIGGVRALSCGLGGFGTSNYATAIHYTGSDVVVWGSNISGGTSTNYCCVEDLANFERVELHGGSGTDVFTFQYFEPTTSTWYGLEGNYGDPIDEGYMSGKGGDDVLIGSNVGDALLYDHDHLRGDGDHDDLCGGAGPDDILDGAAGDDVLWDDDWSAIIGGPGFDECPFYSPASPPAGAGCDLARSVPPSVCL